MLQSCGRFASLKKKHAQMLLRRIIGCAPLSRKSAELCVSVNIITCMSYSLSTSGIQCAVSAVITVNIINAGMHASYHASS